MAPIVVVHPRWGKIYINDMKLATNFMEKLMNHDEEALIAETEDAVSTASPSAVTASVDNAAGTGSEDANDGRCGIHELEAPVETGLHEQMVDMCVLPVISGRCR